MAPSTDPRGWGHRAAPVAGEVEQLRDVPSRGRNVAGVVGNSDLLVVEDEARERADHLRQPAAAAAAPPARQMAGEPAGEVRQQWLPVDVTIADDPVQQHQRRPVPMHGTDDRQAVSGRQRGACCDRACGFPASCAVLIGEMAHAGARRPAGRTRRINGASPKGQHSAAEFATGVHPRCSTDVSPGVSGSEACVAASVGHRPVQTCQTAVLTGRRVRG
jgi:hypothetical protein